MTKRFITLINNFFLSALVILLCSTQLFSKATTTSRTRWEIPATSQEKASSFKKNITIQLVEDKNYTENYKLNLFFKAIHQHNTGKLNASHKTFTAILSRKHSNYIYEAYMRLLFDLGSFSTITNLAEKKKLLFAKIFKKNMSLKLIIAQSFLHIGQEEKAEELFLELSQEYPDNGQIAYYTAVSYIKGKEIDQALEFLNKCLDRPTLRPKHFLFLFLKSKVYMIQNKKNKALLSIEQSIKLFPKFDRGLLFKAVLLEQLGRINEAIKGYENFLDIVGRDLSIEKQLVQLLFSQEQFNKAAIYLKKIKNDTPEYYFDLALIEMKSKNYHKALNSINSALTKSQYFNKARLLKVEILVALKNIPQVLSFMQKWICEQPHDNAILRTLLLLKKHHVTTKNIIQILENLIEEKKHSLGFFSVLADLYLEEKNYNKSIKYYKKAFNATSNRSLKSKALFHVGHAHYLANQPKKMELALKQSMNYSPTHPSSYNLLAYYYAEKNINLTKALELVDKALRLKPNCYYYLDTKGYILLKLGRKKKSIKILKQAARKAPHNDYVISDRLKQAYALNNE